MMRNNQQVQELFAGRPFCTVEAVLPICVRIARRSHWLLNNGWLPRLDAVPIVEWDPRRYNSIADHCANIALDLGHDWNDDTGQGVATDAEDAPRIRLCVDGALRQQTVAAAGIVVYSYSSSLDRVLLRRAGRYLGPLRSSFEAELISLEWGLDAVIARPSG